MKNITLAIDDDMLNKVRAYAAEQKTTVNAIYGDVQVMNPFLPR